MGGGELSEWALSWMIVVVIGLSPILGAVVIRSLARRRHRKAEGRETNGASVERTEAHERRPHRAPQP